ncbi:MAG: hypothetical protein AAGG51_27355 [Cyanobacteria bacterium P01_G01_bin.54]
MTAQFLPAQFLPAKAMRKLSQALLLSFGVTGLLQILPAQAATVTQCNEAGLKAAIDSSADGGKIVLDCGNSAITLGSELVLNKNLTIDGQGAILDGRDRTRIFRTTKNLTLQNLTLRKGKVNRKAGNFSCEGGAVHVTFGKLILEGVTLQDNFAPRGGAVCGNWQADVEIRDSTFMGNQAHQGGALYTNTSDLLVRDSTFTNNATTVGQGLNGIGGAIVTYNDLNKSTPIRVLNSRFEGNKSFHEGGAAFFNQSNGVNLELRNSTFVNNHAQINNRTGIGSGGAIKLNHSGGKALAKAINVVFANNVADQEGGAVWAGGGNANLDLDFRQVTFYGNESGRVPDPQKNETGGGGIVLVSRGTMKFIKNTFAENQSGNETSGAIYAASNVDHSKVTVRNAVFNNNCSRKDIQGTPEVENCNHFTHSRTVRGNGNNISHNPFSGGNVYEWPVNQHAPTGRAFPITQRTNVQDVQVRPYQDNGDATPDHPCSNVNAGAGGSC